MPFEKTDLALWSRVIGINLTGTFLVTQAALPSVRRAGNGRIINIASTAGLTGYAYVSAYCASKHGVIGLTRALALETARTDVTVNAVCPGFTDTPLLAGAVDTISGKTGRSRDEARASLARANPQGRLVTPRGSGGHGAVAGFGKGDRHHRPGDPGRRRRGHGRLTAMTNPMQDKKRPFKDHKPEHFLFETDADGRVATITLNRPDKKNPLTFQSYEELDEPVPGARQGQRRARRGADRRRRTISRSGGDVFEIIEPLTKMAMPDLLDFTRMTGDLVRQMRACPQPIIAAVDGICAGAGAIIAMAADFRIATPQTKTAFLFTRVGLAGADMGACGILPRIIGQGSASELLFTGRVMTAAEGHAWGFYNALHERGDLLAEARRFARNVADGPWFAHTMTKKMLDQEWAMGIDQIIESEAQAQAICMATGDFRRAFEAFAAKTKPDFKGN